MKINEISTKVVTILSSKKLAKKGATLLSGPWGVGKTYLYENYIKGELVKSADREGVPVIYVSLFGLESVRDIKNFIVAEALTSPHVTMKKETYMNPILWGEVLKGVVNKTQDKIGASVVDFRVDPLKLLPEEIIICFDDLERKSDNLSIKDFFGLISILKEKKNSKILIISNEEQYSVEENEGDEKEVLVPLNERKQYHQYLEKVVSFKFYVKPDLNSFINQLVSRSDEKDFFEEKLELILDIINYAKIVNLRTIDKFFLNVEQVLRCKIRVSDSILRLILFYTSCLSEGLLGKGEEYFDFNSFSLAWYSRKDEKDPELEEKKELLDRHYRESTDYSFNREVFEYILTGFYDEEELKQSIDPDVKRLSAVRQYIHSVTNDIETDIFFLNDRELSVKYEEGKKLIYDDKEEKSAADLVSLYLNVEQIIDNSLGTLERLDLSYIKKEVGERAKRGDSSLEERVFRPSQNLEKVKDVLEFYSECYEKGQEVVIRKKITTLLEEGKVSEFKQLIFNNSINLASFLREFFPDDMLDIYFGKRSFGYSVIHSAISNVHLVEDKTRYKIILQNFLLRLLDDARCENSDVNRVEVLVKQQRVSCNISIDKVIEKIDQKKKCVSV
jgi:hypothetical protein